MVGTNSQAFRGTGVQSKAHRRQSGCNNLPKLKHALNDQGCNWPVQRQSRLEWGKPLPPLGYAECARHVSKMLTKILSVMSQSWIPFADVESAPSRNCVLK